MSYFDVKMNQFVASVADFVEGNLHMLVDNMVDCNS